MSQMIPQTSLIFKSYFRRTAEISNKWESLNSKYLTWRLKRLLSWFMVLFVNLISSIADLSLGFTNESDPCSILDSRKKTEIVILSLHWLLSHCIQLTCLELLNGWCEQLCLAWRNLGFTASPLWKRRSGRPKTWTGVGQRPARDEYPPLSPSDCKSTKSHLAQKESIQMANSSILEFEEILFSASRSIPAGDCCSNRAASLCTVHSV